MKPNLKSAVAAVVLLVAAITGFAQNDKSDAILGKFYSKQGTDEYKVLISKNTNGSYKAQILTTRRARRLSTRRIPTSPCAMFPATKSFS